MDRVQYEQYHSTERCTKQVEYVFLHRGTPAEGNAVDENLSLFLLSTHIRSSKNCLDKLKYSTLNLIVVITTVRLRILLCTQRLIFTKVPHIHVVRLKTVLSHCHIYSAPTAGHTAIVHISLY
jgi:hypothetical protein